MAWELDFLVCTLLILINFNIEIYKNEFTEIVAVYRKKTPDVY
jgi:hypothetical protein